MTRINVIPPAELTDKHLLAEYRELPRVFRLAHRPPNNTNTKRAQRFTIPHEYTLGTGHVRFFYNKLSYLNERFSKIVEEMKRRDFKPQYTQPPINSDPLLYGYWQPTESAIRTNRERIQLRLKEAQQRKEQL